MRSRISRRKLGYKITRNLLRRNRYPSGGRKDAYSLTRARTCSLSRSRAHRCSRETHALSLSRYSSRKLHTLYSPDIRRILDSHYNETHDTTTHRCRYHKRNSNKTRQRKIHDTQYSTESRRDDDFSRINYRTMVSKLSPLDVGRSLTPNREK